MWEYIVLSALTDHELPTQSELARLTRHDKSRLVALLDGLEERGLVSRPRDELDRRARRVGLTKAGRTAQSRAQRDIRHMESTFLGALAGDEREQLLTSLARLEGQQAPPG
jgi:DNA-binding MarR family transcriptional regulator